MKEQLRSVNLEDFACSFDTPVRDIPEDCLEQIGKSDFRYRILTGKERDKILLDVIKKIELDGQVVGTDERRNVWERGWAENLRGFFKSSYNLNELVPKFIRSNQVVRFNQDYIKPSNPNFELDYFSVFRFWLFKKYLADFNSIYELGCGTGFNLAALAQLYPKKKLYGLDFVPSSVALVDKLGEAYNWNITGSLFDMLHPDESFRLDANSAVFTIAAVEQLAGNFEPLLQFILRNSPGLCLHVEPAIELYDENNLVDYLAMKFHRKRGYTENFLTRLRQLEAQNRVEVLKIKRLFFGSLYHEAYSYIIWKPTETR